MRWPTRDGADQFVGVCGKDSWKRKEGAVWLEPRHARSKLAAKILAQDLVVHGLTKILARICKTTTCSFIGGQKTGNKLNKHKKIWVILFAVTEFLATGSQVHLLLVINVI
jgi:hypothetical protein